MNVIKVKVNFSQRTSVKQGVDLTEGDYNSTKMVFDFNTDEGTKIFQMKNPSDEIVLEKEIINNEVILTGKADVTTIHNEKTYVKYLDDSSNVYWYNSNDEELYDSTWVLDTTTSLDTLTKQTEDASIFTETGSYVYEISLYDGDSKLTSASDKIKVKKKQIGDDSETAVIYKPVFDELISEFAEALDEVDNLDIDASKSGDTATITITDKTGTPKTVQIKDGENGTDGIDGIDAKINGVNTISIEAGENITLDQEGNTLTISSTETEPIFTASASYGISSSDISNWDNKGTYSKPSGGIPATDLSSAVQTSLGKADTALQSETYTGTITGITMNGTSKGTSGVVDLGTVITSHQDISGKQNINDNTLTTTHKTIPTAINEINSIAKGANQAVSYNNYSTMITTLNSLAGDVYNIGQNIYIQTLEVPDLWISDVYEESTVYTYVDDETIVNELKQYGYIEVGYYAISMLETQKVDLTNYVTNTDYATTNKGGVFKYNANYGTNVDGNGYLRGVTVTYANYADAHNLLFVSKATLENVITGKGLVSNTDYATSSTGGVVKVSNGDYGMAVDEGVLKGTVRTYAQYSDMSSKGIVCKGTLENVITGKSLVSAWYGTQSQYDDLATINPDTLYCIVEQ